MASTSKSTHRLPNRKKAPVHSLTNCIDIDVRYPEDLGEQRFSSLCYKPDWVKGDNTQHVSERVKNHEPVITLKTRATYGSVKEWWDLIVNNNSFHHICEIIRCTPLGPMLECDFDGNDKGLILSIAERWWDTTHTFHLPWGEMTITPLDMYMITGLTVGQGKLVPSHCQYEEYSTAVKFFTNLQPEDMRKRGVRPVYFKNSYVQPLKEARSEGRVLAAPEAGSEMEREYIRAFLFYYITSVFFTNADNSLRLGWLAAVVDYEQLHTYDWGGAALCHLYRDLDAFVRSTGTSGSLGGCSHILMYWMWEYLRVMHPVLAKMNENIFPRMGMWNKQFRSFSKYETNHNLHLAREQIEKKLAGGIKWEPWKSNSAYTSTLGTTHHRLSRCRVLLADENIRCWYFGERCWAQHGYGQRVPRNPHPSMNPELTDAVPAEVIYQHHQEGWPYGEKFLYPGSIIYELWWKEVSMGYLLPPVGRSVNFESFTSQAIRPEFRLIEPADPDGEMFAYDHYVPGRDDNDDVSHWTFEATSSKGHLIHVPIQSMDETVVDNLCPDWRSLPVEDLQPLYSEAVRMRVAMGYSVKDYTQELYGVIRDEQQKNSRIRNILEEQTEELQTRTEELQASRVEVASLMAQLAEMGFQQESRKKIRAEHSENVL